MISSYEPILADNIQETEKAAKECADVEPEKTPADKDELPKTNECPLKVLYL